MGDGVGKKRYLLVLILLGSSLLFSPLGQGAEPIKIGAIYNVTGYQDSIDQPGLEGAELAVKEINEKGGLLGRPVQLIPMDGRTQVEAVKMAMTQLVQAHRVVGVIGLNDSTYALAAGPIAQEAKVPFLTSGATLPSLPVEVGDYMFMAAFGDDAQAHVAARFAAKDLKAKTAWILTDTSASYTRALSDFFRARFKALAGPTAVITEDSYKSGDRKFSLQIGRLLNLRPQPHILMVSSLPRECGLIVKQIRDLGIETPIVSGDGFDTPLLVKIAGKVANDVYFTTHVSYENPRLVVQEFVRAYKKEYGFEPEDAFAALGYDAIRLMAAAVEKAKSSEPAAIRNALATTKGFQGVTGTLTYGKDNRVPKKAVTLVRMTDERIRFLKEFPPEEGKGISEKTRRGE